MEMKHWFKRHQYSPHSNRGQGWRNWVKSTQIPLLKHANDQNEMKIPIDANALKQTKKRHDPSDGQGITNQLKFSCINIYQYIIYCT